MYLIVYIVKCLRTRYKYCLYSSKGVILQLYNKVFDFYFNKIFLTTYLLILKVVNLILLEIIFTLYTFILKSSRIKYS